MQSIPAARLWSSIIWANVLFASACLVGCGKENVVEQERSLAVRTQVASVVSHARTASLTGEFRARVQSDLGFRMGGRISSRNVDVGAHVAAGDVLATLDTQEQQADLATAKAALRSAEATLQQATANVERRAALLASRAASQEEYDEAKATFLAAQGSVEIGKSQVSAAESKLDFTEIRADAAGVIIARNAEVGQVVAPAQPVFTLAVDGDREAVFDAFQTHVAERPVDDLIDITLVSNTTVKTTGLLREIAPSIDPASGTVRVKVAISSVPPQMTLGAPVTGVARFQSSNVVMLPWTALYRQGDQAVVWVVDPASSTVSERAVTVHSFVSGMILVGDGLKDGDVVVTDGVQLIRPGQKVNAIPRKNS